ncbi:aminotransferase class I/II-fold pyridoxal phosphate-dependent enzyme [Rickettsiella grylli]|uniref:8-amino-7-oxononanoate synthase (Aons) (8-amino-7-ketopelargonate synthase) (7-keto-8-amino-pelargonic acid synthetase)(7-kap synthetase) (L-alanine--pimelyl coa ligase) n=1 Tax=Rickettsiella grylli TaxID=59196 RepID=A8PQ75_9COXI|nr:8-amino-7-oxononanoate synthase [Rickettsiella grylli]EDP46031.1 8-amino-7-oxononanoate synthase (aons) (8-amino-7-ketopelargonate synthase) (7-keto-8-amino-pelargonic acid synthetase)(7-kap synthetase) (l-alanine--pimelyl coa ligase) [Rickettsiella grylli]
MSLIFQKLLSQHKEKGLLRERQVLQRQHGMQRCYQQKYVSFFSSNDYLGLAQHSAVIKAFKQAVDDFGVGSGSSYLLGAYNRFHQELELALAEFLNFPKVLVFSTGYMANLGLLGGLLQRGTALFADKLSHASLLDGAKLSDALLKRYKHNNLASLKKHLTQSSAPYKFIMTDGVFSMDGDIAPLPALIEIAQHFSSLLLVDDAHGIGVLGENGAGTCEHFGCKPDILSGGFGKAFGCFGGFVASNAAIIENLIQFARPYMYTTALPAAFVKAAYTSLLLLQKETWRREKLWDLIHTFKQVAKQLELPLLPSNTPIQPILVKDTKQTMALSAYLLQKGFLVHAIRPPTVAEKTSRLRINLSILHSKSEINRLLKQIALGLKMIKNK